MTFDAIRFVRDDALLRTHRNWSDMVLSSTRSYDDLCFNFDRYPRVSPCYQTTPIDPLVRLSEVFGEANFFMKCDDCRGLATGGNKTRKLEFLTGDVLKQNGDMLVTQGATPRPAG